MTYTDYAVIACAAFTMALIAFPNQAANMGWRTGRMFALPAQRVTILSGVLAIGLILHVVVGVATGSLSLWWLLILPSAAFGGGALITGIFGRSSGVVALIFSPATFLAASYFHATGQ